MFRVWQPTSGQTVTIAYLWKALRVSTHASNILLHPVRAVKTQNLPSIKRTNVASGRPSPIIKEEALFSLAHTCITFSTRKALCACVRACMCAGGPSGAVSGDRRITQQLLRVLAASPATAIIRNKARMRSNCQLSTHVCLHLFALKLRLSPRRIFNSQISGNLFSFCLSPRRSDHKPPAIRHHGERLTIAKTTFAQSPTNSVHTSRVLNVTIGHTGAESFFRRPTWVESGFS